jgi:NADPH-dependent curcumin reductase
VVRGPVIARVEVSRSPDFVAGDWVSGMFGWEERSVVAAGQAQKISVAPGIPAAAHLTVFSHVGRAAAMGLFAVGQLQAKDTVLVSAAAGATGALAAQIAKAQGCRTIGIAGSPAKCHFLLDELGLDGAIDYKSEDLGAALQRLCPQGVDLFFDNVGGATLDTVLLHLARGARIVVCGAMSQYDLAPGETPYGVKNLPLLVFRSARMEGFVVPQFAQRYGEFDALLGRLLASGQIRHRAHVVHGLEATAEALGLLMTGSHEGKLMVQLVPEPAL